MIKTRQVSIDYVKSALTIGMILAHSLQLLSSLKGIYYYFSLFINLITFSGFVFCFGYVFYISYFVKEYSKVKNRIFKTAWKTLVGYYISGLASLLFLTPLFNHKPYLYTNLWKLFLFINVPWYSEFLLAFFLFTILSLVLFKFFNYLISSNIASLIVVSICFLATIIIPADFIVSGPIALFIGSSDQGLFPIIQYLPFFIAGIYFSRNKIVFSRTIFILCLFGTLSFLSYLAYKHESPLRFPPSILWILGSLGIIYIYYLLAKWVEQKGIFIPLILSIGQNSLFYLILSNLILFALSSILKTSQPIALSIGILVILIITFLVDLIVKQPKPSESVVQSE